MKYLILFSVFSISAMDSPKDVVLVCHHIQHQRCRSYPITDHDYFSHQKKSELTIDIPEDQIRPESNEDKEYRGKCCSPSKIVVLGSICTACAGVATAIITATVTLIIHFTTK